MQKKTSGDKHSRGQLRTTKHCSWSHSSPSLITPTFPLLRFSRTKLSEDQLDLHVDTYKESYDNFQLPDGEQNSQNYQRIISPLLGTANALLMRLLGRTNITKHSHRQLSKEGNSGIKAARNSCVMGIWYGWTELSCSRRKNRLLTKKRATATLIDCTQSAILQSFTNHADFLKWNHKWPHETTEKASTASTANFMSS